MNENQEAWSGCDITDYPGIDYSGGAGVNVDKDTGIHYGVIGLGAVDHNILEDFEAYYGEPTCPECGEILNGSVEIPDSAEGDGGDYYCKPCNKALWSDRCYGDEPVSNELDKDGVQAVLHSDNDIWVFKSPYYTLAQYCSPCCPGAGNLEYPCPSGVKTYCLGHDYFEGGRAPYPVWSVETGEVVQP